MFVWNPVSHEGGVQHGRPEGVCLYVKIIAASSCPAPLSLSCFQHSTALGLIINGFIIDNN